MKLIDELVNKFDVKVHSEIACYPDDIDISVKNEDVIQLKSYLLSVNAVLIEERDGILKHLIYINDYLYILDIKYEFQVYCKHLSSVELSENGSDSIRDNECVHKIFKYLCQKRVDKLEYIKRNFDKFEQFINDDNNFNYLSLEIVTAINDRDINQTFIAFNKRRVSDGFFLFIKSYFNLLKEFIRCLYPSGLGKSVAFIGPDGSGKSFYIEKLSYPVRQKKIYMGDWFFKFQPIYNKVMKVGSPYNRFLYVFYFMENYLRSFKVGMNKLLGFTVLIDRFPGTNRNVAKTGLLGVFNKLSYKVVKKPDNIILLYASPTVIYNRKQELTIKEIESIQNEIKLLVGDRLTIVNTEDSNKALNEILSLIYKND